MFLVLAWLLLLLVWRRVVGWGRLELLVSLWWYGRLSPLQGQRLWLEEMLLGRWGGVVAAWILRRLVRQVVIVYLAPVAAPVEYSGAFGVR